MTIAFFDVDETLIDTKSMFDFLRFVLAEAGDDGTAYREQAGALQQAAADGTPRSEINRAYYRLFTGRSWTDLQDAGHRWYAELCRRDRPFLAEGLAAFHRHRAAGDVTVLVSGSFRPCLDPIAEHLGATAILCTEPLLDGDGRLTGEVRVPMIGDHKRAAAQALIDQSHADPAACHGYGDHASDLPFLTLVGHPAVIGSNPDLLEAASRGGWPVHPATPCPAPAGPAPVGPVPAGPVPAGAVPAGPVLAGRVLGGPVPGGPVWGGFASSAPGSAGRAPAGPAAAGAAAAGRSSAGRSSAGPSSAGCPSAGRPSAGSSSAGRPSAGLAATEA